MLCMGSFIPLISLEPENSTQRDDSRFRDLINPMVFIYVITQTWLSLPFPPGQNLHL